MNSKKVGGFLCVGKSKRDFVFLISSIFLSKGQESISYKNVPLIFFWLLYSWIPIYIHLFTTSYYLHYAHSDINNYRRLRFSLQRLLLLHYKCGLYSCDLCSVVRRCCKRHVASGWYSNLCGYTRFARPLLSGSEMRSIQRWVWVHILVRRLAPIIWPQCSLLWRHHQPLAPGVSIYSFMRVKWGQVKRIYEDEWIYKWMFIEGSSFQ